METITITRGTGLVDLAGTVDQGVVRLLLHLGGRAARSDQPDDADRLIERAEGDAVRPYLPHQLRIALATGQLRRPLAATLRPLLDQLADGRYELDGPERLIPEPDGASWDVVAPGPGDAVRVGPEQADRYVVPTAADWPPADVSRIGYYRSAIRRGHRPAIVLLQLADAGRIGGFVLDGHHALAAYQVENRIPAVVRISRIEPPDIPDAQPQAYSAS